jgi:hypothetical protein
MSISVRIATARTKFADFRAQVWTALVATVNKD